MQYNFLKLLIIFFLFSACKSNSSNPGKTMVDYKPGTFGYDLNFLNKHDSIILLKNGNSEVAVSPKYQAKVFTSSANGDSGMSFGWINYKAFSPPADAHMNAFGGENRYWLGPEGGRFSIFFAKDKKMEFANWKTPAAFDTESWNVTEKTPLSVTLQKDMQLTNYAGTTFNLSANRQVTISSNAGIFYKIGMDVDTTVKAVGYSTTNVITNTGNVAWNEKTGMPAMWMLDMFKPSDKTVIVVPYKTNKAAAAKVATTDYFGEIPADRIKYKNGLLLFKADGKSRGKLGISPTSAMPAAGSYDAQNNILTIAIFEIDTAGKYLNQEWNIMKPTFSGDAVNAYNDGPLENGSQMGPFYEIESVSPAAFLQPGASLSHKHAVLHFTGSAEGINKIAQHIFGISLADISGVFTR